MHMYLNTRGRRPFFSQSLWICLHNVSRICHRSITSFPALVACFLFSRACYGLHIFPRLLPHFLLPVSCFPALFSGYKFSCACPWLHVFPCLPLATCFSALGTDEQFPVSTADLSSDWFISGGEW